MEAVRKIIKVAYFDEISAIDYLDIYNGGLISSKQEKSSKLESQMSAKGEVSVKTGILSKVLEPFLSVNASGSIQGDLAKIGEKVINTTISNTVLSDYIDIAYKDQNVCKIIDFTVRAYEDSVSFMKMYTPLLNMFELKTQGVDFSKMDETLEMIKGYFELLAENSSGEQKILRFNIKAFRNNYNLVDLTKMNLTFYAVKVGEMKIDQLNATNEFDLHNKGEIPTRETIIGSETESTMADEFVPFYDVILAGIVADG